MQLYFNTIKQELTDASNVRLKSKPSLVFQQKPTWQITFHEGLDDSGNLKNYDMTNLTTFVSAIDKDFDHATSPLVLSSLITKTDSALTIALDADTAELQYALSGKANLGATFEIKGATSAGIESFCVQFAVQLNNTIYVRGNPPSTPSITYTEEAPEDGKNYVRCNRAWGEITTGGGGISEAPSDGKIYGRQNGQWVEITSGGGGGGDIPDGALVDDLGNILTDDLGNILTT